VTSEQPFHRLSTAESHAIVPHIRVIDVAHQPEPLRFCAGGDRCAIQFDIFQTGAERFHLQVNKVARRRHQRFRKRIPQLWSSKSRHRPNCVPSRVCRVIVGSIVVDGEIQNWRWLSLRPSQIEKSRVEFAQPDFTFVRVIRGRRKADCAERAVRSLAPPESQKQHRSPYNGFEPSEGIVNDIRLVKSCEPEAMPIPFPPALRVGKRFCVTRQHPTCERVNTWAQCVFALRRQTKRPLIRRMKSSGATVR